MLYFILGNLTDASGSGKNVNNAVSSGEELGGELVASLRCRHNWGQDLIAANPPLHIVVIGKKAEFEKQVDIESSHQMPSACPSMNHVIGRKASCEKFKHIIIL